MSETTEKPISAAALRMRRLRARKRRGGKCFLLEIGRQDIDRLIGRHLLDPAQRDDDLAVEQALIAWLDRLGVVTATRPYASLTGFTRARARTSVGPILQF